MDVKVQICHLHQIREEMTHVTNDILRLRDKYVVTIDEEEIEKTLEVIERLKEAIETTPIA